MNRFTCIGDGECFHEPRILCHPCAHANIGVFGLHSFALTGRLFASAKAGEVSLCLSAVTIAETFYVLNRVYKLSRSDAGTKILPLVQSVQIDVEDRNQVVDALRRVIKSNVDFGDAWLAATAAETGGKVASFDRDLKKFTDVVTVVPGLT